MSKQKQNKIDEKTICYTGYGAKASGKHTEREFLQAMKKSASQCKDKCPTDVSGWIEWSGAEKETVEKCDKLVKNNKKINQMAKIADMDVETFRKCVASSCDAIIKSVKANNKSDSNILSVAVCAAQKCQKSSVKVAKSNDKYANITK